MTAHDYKNTLNLPQTEFPMKANLSEREPKCLEHWQRIDLYQQLRGSRRGQKKFILLDGPPYANGNIHIGHAVNKILKDIVLKSKTLAGYDTPYVPGWDCHGLPIELNVEKKIGKAGLKVASDVFRKACRDYAASQIKVQSASFQRLGVIGDWQHSYATMDFSFEASTVRALGLCLEQGHLVRGYKPVHWCLECGSALAEAEVEYADKSSPSIDVAFVSVSSAEFMARFGVPSQKALKSVVVVIWTTTPWTLPANEAVALHPEAEYILWDCGEHYRVVAKELSESLELRWQIPLKITAGVSGKALEGLTLNHPFLKRAVPIVLGEHVAMDAGTGAVHTAPAFGLEDFAIGQEYHLPITNPIQDNGCFDDSVVRLAGFKVWQANEAVLAWLIECECLLHQSSIQHSYPHCWRHKTPIIFRATLQWFIKVNDDPFQQALKKAFQEVTWVPSWGEARMAGMLVDRPDWCISRQRTWGTPLTLLVHRTTGEVHPRMVALIEPIAKRIEQEGIEAWFKLDLQTLLNKEEALEYIKLNDILDVWFDAGMAHHGVLVNHPELEFPADLYLEGSDQYRGWFQSSLLTAMAIHGQAPYKTVLTHGFAVDAFGHKMSKSLGNVVEPEKVIATVGADVLRLWVAATDYRGEMSVSDEILKRMSDAYRRIRNTIRFLLANLHEFDPKQHFVPMEEMLALDRFIVDVASRAQQEIIAAYDQYQFHLIYQKIQHFCIVELGGFYLDIIKDRQYTLPKLNTARRSAQTALFLIAEALTRWIAPILSFTAEEIWQLLPGERELSVFLSTWSSSLILLPEDSAMNASFWNKIIEARQAVNKALEEKRAQNIIGSPLEAKVTLYAQADWLSLLSKLEAELRFVLITSLVILKPITEAPATILEYIPGLKIEIEPITHNKCGRCWHYREDVGQVLEHPELCGRCLENISGLGEHRKYA